MLDTVVAAETPEGIVLELHPAGLPARFYAFVLDWLIRLVIMYAIAIVRNHPFLDGNKRTGWVAMRTFFALNEIALTFSPAAAVAEVMALAAGERDDDAFTAWVRGCVQP